MMARGPGPLIQRVQTHWTWRPESQQSLRRPGQMLLRWQLLPAQASTGQTAQPDSALGWGMPGPPSSPGPGVRGRERPRGNTFIPQNFEERMGQAGCAVEGRDRRTGDRWTAIQTPSLLQL